MLRCGPGGWNTAAERASSQLAMAAHLPKGNAMMRQPMSLSPSHLDPRRVVPAPSGAALCAGFTLVEMLVVITIIGILAGLITARRLAARSTPRTPSIVVELSQLDTACKAYKEKFGEYPPDFTDQNAVLRHLAKAFPRYHCLPTLRLLLRTYLPAGEPTLIRQFHALPGSRLLARWKADVEQRYGDRVYRLRANPQDPFDNSASRIEPFFDFDPNRVSSSGTGHRGR